MIMAEERNTIYLCLAHMSEEGIEQKYVKEAFDTNWVVPMGPNVNAFEQNLADFANSNSDGSKLDRKVVCLSAGTAAVCGIAYLDDAGYDMIGKIIVNALGAVGGIVCDGAKASCAAKIASAVEAGLLAYEMARKGKAYAFGEGLVEGDYEQTIRNIGRMGRDGMRSTDEEILHISVRSCILWS